MPKPKRLTLQGMSDALVKIDKLIKNEPDRGAALVGVAYLDDTLRSVLRDYLVQDTRILDCIFDRSGTAATFSAKIDLAYSVGLLHRMQFNDLHTMRKIRNEFAHSWDDISFQTDNIKQLCFNLEHSIEWLSQLKKRVSDEVLKKLQPRVPDKSNPREFFRFNLMSIGIGLRYRPDIKPLVPRQEVFRMEYGPLGNEWSPKHLKPKA